MGGKGIVVPAAWGMFTFRLPPMTSPRSLDGDRKMVSDSLRVLEKVAARTGTVVYLEPLNRYQDHMINTLADARRYIVENDLKHVQIIGDFYHMNIEEDNLAQALHDNRDLLGHVHIADNHRYQPGSGTLDFHALLEQLRADNFQGYVVYEGRIRAEDRSLSKLCRKVLPNMLVICSSAPSSIEKMKKIAIRLFLNRANASRPSRVVQL